MDFRPKKSTILGARSIPPPKSSASARILRCWRAAKQRAAPLLAGQASVARSQQYYLDITDPLANKGAALHEIAALLGVPLAEIAVIGDGGNDVAMFKLGGLSIAMGNASADVQAQADLVTETYDNEGFANAIERFILCRAGSATTRVS